MKWTANPPIKSSIHPRLNVQDYKTDIALDFELGDFLLENGDIKTVSGFDNFKQKVQRYVLTPKTERWPFGFEHKIFETKTQSDFEAESEKLAKQLVSQVLSDSTATNPNGLGHTIESVISMEKVAHNSREYLNITMTVSGIKGAIVVSVPFPQK